MLAGMQLLSEQVQKLSAKPAQLQAQPQAQVQAQPPDAWLKYLQQRQAQQQQQPARQQLSQQPPQQQPQQQAPPGPASSAGAPPGAAPAGVWLGSALALLRPIHPKDVEKLKKFESGNGWFEWAKTFTRFLARNASPHHRWSSLLKKAEGLIGRPVTAQEEAAWVVELGLGDAGPSQGNCPPRRHGRRIGCLAHPGGQRPFTEANEPAHFQIQGARAAQKCPRQGL